MNTARNYDNAIKVTAFDRQGNKVGVYDSMAQACRKLLITIAKYRSGRRKLINSEEKLNKYCHSRLLNKDVYFLERK